MDYIVSVLISSAIAATLLCFLDEVFRLLDKKRTDKDISKKRLATFWLVYFVGWFTVTLLFDWLGKFFS